MRRSSPDKSDLQKILNTLREHLGDLRRRYGVKSLGVFGSFVRGEQTRRSDLDILVEFEEGASVTLLQFVRLENELTELLGVKVDLVERPALKPAIGQRILGEVRAA